MHGEVRKFENLEVEEATFSSFTTMQENNVALCVDPMVCVADRIYALFPRSSNKNELQFSH